MAAHYPVDFAFFGGNKGPWVTPLCSIQSKGKIGLYKYNVNLDSKRLGLPLRTLEGQLYINYSQKHDSNIGLEAYHNVIRHVRKVERVIWYHY